MGPTTSTPSPSRIMAGKGGGRAADAASREANASRYLAAARSSLEVADAGTGGREMATANGTSAGNSSAAVEEDDEEAAKAWKLGQEGKLCAVCNKTLQSQSLQQHPQLSCSVCASHSSAHVSCARLSASSSSSFVCYLCSNSPQKRKQQQQPVPVPVPVVGHLIESARKLGLGVAAIGVGVSSRARSAAAFSGALQRTSKRKVVRQRQAQIYPERTSQKRPRMDAEVTTATQQTPAEGSSPAHTISLNLSLARTSPKGALVARKNQIQGRQETSQAPTGADLNHHDIDTNEVTPVAVRMKVKEKAEQVDCSAEVIAIQEEQVVIEQTRPSSTHKYKKPRRSSATYSTSAPARRHSAPRSAKRGLNTSTTGAQAKRPRTSIGGSVSGRRLPVLKRPALHAVSAATGKSCAFCGVRGKQRACEGRLLRVNAHIHVHRNCAYWAPEVYEDRSAGISAGLMLRGVEDALQRSSRQKCCLCGAPGPTLACMYKGKKCCRPMHFRCALRGGASLILQGDGDGYHTLCPIHAGVGVNGEEDPAPGELLHVQTPVREPLLENSSACSECDGDNYDPLKGTILSCAACPTRIHSKCLSSTMQFDGAYAVASEDGKFRCEKCLACEVCGQNVSELATCTGQSAGKEMLIKRCLVCRHAAVHKACVQSTNKKGDGKQQPWRCDICRVCRHCDARVEEASTWNEELIACKPCADAHVDGVICPVCKKVYRDGENVPMIQCDYCDLWLHKIECSSLSEEEFKEMETTDKKYMCPVCTETRKAKRKERKKYMKKEEEAADLETDDESDEERICGRPERSGRKIPSQERENVPARAPDAPIYASSDEEDGADFQFHYKPTSISATASTDTLLNRNSLDHASEAAPHNELCLICASSGNAEEMRFCAECGEAFHGFCLESSLPRRWNDGYNPSTAKGTLHRLIAGGTGPQAMPWKCPRCTTCTTCGTADGDKLVVLCDHCDRGFHMQCLQPPRAGPPDGDFTCDECLKCEMCGASGVGSLNVVDEHCFCGDCTEVVRQAVACSVCHVRFPRFRNRQEVAINRHGFVGNTRAAKSDCATEVAKDVEFSQYIVKDDGREALKFCEGSCQAEDQQAKQHTLKFAARSCSKCSALIHAACDSSVEFTASNPKYLCPVCRRASEKLKPIVNCRNTGVSVMANGNGMLENIAVGRGKLLPFSGDATPSDCEGDVDGNDSDSSELDDEAHSPSSLNGGMNELDLAKRLLSPKLHVEQNGIISTPQRHSARIFVSDFSVWRVASNDRRTCELCRKCESPTVQEGRLIPLTPDPGLNGQHCWVHAGCMLWSHGVHTLENSKRQVLLYGSRKAVVAHAKSSMCSRCGNRGATLSCSEKDCTHNYHLLCGMRSGMVCVKPHFLTDVTKTEADASLKDRKKRTTAAGKYVLYCRTHAELLGIDENKKLLLDDAQKNFNLNRSIRMTQLRRSKTMNMRMRKDAVLSPKSLVRVGALTVLALGQLVPNSSEFVRPDALIPSGYRATRRYWSISNPGDRCLYYLEVMGDANSGPLYVIRPSDDSDIVIRAPCPDKAWKYVLQGIQEMWSACGLTDSFCTAGPSGLEAFGLTKCRPVVTLVESLPMAWMFRQRYEFQFRNPRVVDAETMAMASFSGNLSAKQHRNPSGCARTEGYVPKRHRGRAAIPSASSPSPSPEPGTESDSPIVPIFENAPTGEEFQFSVAMEAEARDSAKTSRDGIPCAPPSAADPSNIGSTTGHGKRKMPVDDRSAPSTNAVSLPHAMQHRMMQRQWKHRTIVLRSRIEGWGMFATAPYRKDDLIIEYVGEVIRPAISDLRERYYDSKGIGCYMFQIEPGRIVDATMRGNAARFINHSCDPNCYSRTITVENGRRVVAIFAKRHIKRGEELSYDYMFPLDEADKVSCGCGSVRCKGFMN